jgi:hypothetical protein
VVIGRTTLKPESGFQGETVLSEAVGEFVEQLYHSLTGETFQGETVLSEAVEEFVGQS